MDTLARIVSLTRPPAAAEHVAEQLIELVRSGNLRAGEALPGERELAAAFHVGRPAVREALRGLRALGVLDARADGRCCVADPDVPGPPAPPQLAVDLNEASLERLYAARVVVECGLLRLGAATITEAALAELHDMAVAGHGLLGDRVAYRVLDLEFHRKLMTLAGNPFLEKTARGLYGLGMEYRRTASAMGGVIARSAAEHTAIVQALRTRDPALAAEAMRVHLTSIHRSTMEAMRMAGRA